MLVASAGILDGQRNLGHKMLKCAGLRYEAEVLAISCNNDVDFNCLDSRHPLNSRITI